VAPSRLAELQLEMAWTHSSHGTEGHGETVNGGVGEAFGARLSWR
jgi:hypothetical protein